MFGSIVASAAKAMSRAGKRAGGRMASRISRSRGGRRSRRRPGGRTTRSRSTLSSAVTGRKPSSTRRRSSRAGVRNSISTIAGGLFGGGRAASKVRIKAPSRRSGGRKRMGGRCK